MDIRDEIKLSKAVLVSDSDQNKHRNKLLGVKPINRVPSIKSKLKDTGKSNSPIKSKLNDTGKSNSPKSRWVSMSKRVFSPQPVSQYNPITGEVRKEIEKSAVDNPKVSKVSDDPVVAAVESVVKESVKVPSKVTGKVSDESVKESVMVPVVKKSVKASSDKIDLVANKRSSLVAEKIDVVKEKVDVVANKASNALKNKLTGKVLRLSKQEENPEVKAKVNVKRKMILSKEDDKKKKLKGKLKKDVSDSELETDVVDYSSDEADRKRKKLKIKAGLERKRSGSDSSDSSEIDTKSIKLLISKLEKKVEKEVSDEESLPKKGNKKLTKKVKKEESVEDRILKKGDKIKVTPSKIHDMLGVPLGGYSLFDLDEREIDHEFADGLKGQICLDVVRRLREDSVISDIDWCGYIYDCLQDSKLPGGTNHYLGPLAFLILLYLDSTKFDKFSVVRTRPAIRNWSSYLMKQRQELEFKDHVVGILDLHDEWNEAEVQESKGFIGFSETSEKEDLIKKAKEKLSLICAERVILEDYMRKASLKCHGDGKFVALYEKYVNLFKDPTSFKDDRNGDNVGDDDDENGDDDEKRDDDGGNVNNDVNGDSEDVNEGDKDPNGSNPSFGFSKISLEDFGNDCGLDEKDKAVEENTTEQGTVVEGTEAEEGEIMSTPENFTQWLEKNMDLVGEGDLFGDNSATLESMNQGITPEKLPTQTYLFAMQGDKMVILSKSHEIHSESHEIHSESHFKGNKDGLALGSIDLVFFPICKSEHFYVVVFSLTKTTAMTILDNSPGTYDSKYKEVCDLLYGHIRHTQVAKVKHTIPKLKWNTKENFHDYGIFTMLHMETLDGGPGSNLDCGLPVESQLQRDMLRRLRFKFATKILLHEINVHAGKMLELANEFDKTDRVEKMAIIVDEFKKREERREVLCPLSNASECIALE
uniref:Ulp1 protease family, C-terminal catalytic domain-containing protein n=1 Tax=Tanacetum cinerariifolium TaxID=118510 RepID=A0A6L2JZI7_TANCI|nr:hypothetical protein [Tanacetum cinerariifolium]